MEEEEEDTAISANYLFRGVEYVVTMKVHRNSTLSVEVEDRLTSDQWRGSFDSAYIEDLTHKTGNFKQFSIFVSMLESALEQSTDSVSLDLLTYSDLESLRQRKAGISAKPVITGKAAGLNTKRYLILTYTVEFDRIHYPLPLPYVGKPDPRHLQETVRKLRAEIVALKDQEPNDYVRRELEKQKIAYETLLEEKESLEAEFLQFRREVRNTTSGSTAKELRIVKNMVKNLEEQLMKEKNKHQRSASKRSQEYRNLLEEVEELRASERNLKVRVKSLTNELALYKRRQSKSPAMFNSQSSQPGRRRSTSREHPRSSFSRDRSSSRERSGTIQRRQPFSRDRSSSLERPGSFGRSFRAASITPPSSGTRNPRFDPTAYIREKDRKKQEMDLRKRLHSRRNQSGSSEKKLRPSSASDAEARLAAAWRRNRSRTSSVESIGSRGSFSDVGMSDSSQTRPRNTKRTLRNRQIGRAVAWGDSPTMPLKSKTNQQRSILSSTPESSAASRRRRVVLQGKENRPLEGDSDYFNRSAEISEIDERLSRLQAFMKANLA